MLASAGGWQRPDAQEIHVNNRAGRKPFLTTLKRMGFQRKSRSGFDSLRGHQSTSECS